MLHASHLGPGGWLPESTFSSAMLRRFLMLAALSLSAIAHAEPDVRLPPGTRSDAHGQLVSGRGLRDTSDFLASELARRGIAVQQIGPHGVRGVELTRFLSRTPS